MLYNGHLGPQNSSETDSKRRYSVFSCVESGIDFHNKQTNWQSHALYIRVHSAWLG